MNKPAGVKIIAISLIIYGVVIFLVTAGSMFLLHKLPDDKKIEFVEESKPFDTDNLEQFGKEVLPIYFIFSIISIFLIIVGVGILRLKSWARWIAICFSLYASISSFPSLFAGLTRFFFAIFHVVGGITICFYLFQSKVKKLFQ